MWDGQTVEDLNILSIFESFYNVYYIGACRGIRPGDVRDSRSLVLNINKLREFSSNVILLINIHSISNWIILYFRCLMNLKEKARAKVKELDQRMAELNAMYEKETDPEKERILRNEILSIAAKTNMYLRMAGADEQEMYAD